jgi:cystathionine beta-lyase
MAPTKTFNIAGIVSSYAIVPEKNLRQKFFSFLHARELDEGTIFAFEATKAAYIYGAEWLQQMQSYIINNVNFVTEYLEKEIPEIKPYKPQASFLIWLDCRALNLSQKELVSLFKDKAGLALNDGTMFGKEGYGYMRLNIGCPRSVIKKALASLKEALLNK